VGAAEINDYNPVAVYARWGYAHGYLVTSSFDSHKRESAVGDGRSELANITSNLLIEEPRTPLLGNWVAHLRSRVVCGYY
jgi:hypothetical protein